MHAELKSLGSDALPPYAFGGCSVPGMKCKGDGVRDVKLLKFNSLSKKAAVTMLLLIFDKKSLICGLLRGQRRLRPERFL